MMTIRQAKSTSGVMLVAVALVAAVAAGGQDGANKVYDDFNAFCKKYFGAEKEPLVYEKFGRDLKFTDGGSWRHVSERSACVAFETSLPAKAWVEYGETARYGKRTPEPERHFYIHVHYLEGLEVGKACHYRLVAVDERGRRVTSKDRTFTTRAIPAAVHIPGDLSLIHI